MSSSISKLSKCEHRDVTARKSERAHFLVSPRSCVSQTIRLSFQQQRRSQSVAKTISDMTIDFTDKYEFDEQSFVEHYLLDYSSNQDIADIDDICCVLDNDYDDDKRERLAKAGYFDMTINELRSELRTLKRKVLTQAFHDYLITHYITPEL